MKKLLILTAGVLLIASFVSCEGGYSPMNNYIEAVKQRTIDSTRHANEVKSFLDSMNTKYHAVK